eukprot:s130_g27.t1
MLHVDLDLRLAAVALLVLGILYFWRRSRLPALCSACKITSGSDNAAEKPACFADEIQFNTPRSVHHPAVEWDVVSTETPRSSHCASGPRRSFLQALTAFNTYMATSRAANAKMDIIDTADPNKCIYCFGDGFLTCWRCSGTKKMTEIDDPSKTRDCSECEATGYKPCGTCQTTGLSPKLVKLYARDEKFRKVMARLRKTKCDEDGRAKIKRVMTNAIAEVEAKQAQSEGRDAMILKVPEAPAPEPSGTWIGS